MDKPTNPVVGTKYRLVRPDKGDITRGLAVNEIAELEPGEDGSARCPWFLVGDRKARACLEWSQLSEIEEENPEKFDWNRERVYALIDGEREYQCEKHGTAMDPKHSVADWIIFMEAHLIGAKAEVYDLNKPAALAQIRKIAALAVACMEHNETEPRV